MTILYPDIALNIQLQNVFFTKQRFQSRYCFKYLVLKRFFYEKTFCGPAARASRRWVPDRSRSAKPTATKWLNRVNRVGLDLRGKELSPVQWQSEIEHLLSSEIDLKDLTQLIDFDKILNTTSGGEVYWKCPKCQSGIGEHTKDPSKGGCRLAGENRRDNKDKWQKQKKKHDEKKAEEARRKEEQREKERRRVRRKTRTSLIWGQRMRTRRERREV